MEDQVYDGQTQCTGQAMVSCAAVRTELKMVSIFTEDINNTSDTISLSPSEIQLSFKTFSLLTATNSNNYPISEIYDESLLIKDFDNKKIKIPTNSLNNGYNNSNSSSFEIYCITQQHVTTNFSTIIDYKLHLLHKLLALSCNIY